jgi:3-oxoacyl-[acyl-carrier protein] reductase
MKLSGKIALVTGASSGIGAEISKKLSENGACVIINYNKNEDGALNILESIKSNGGYGLAYKFDVANRLETFETIEEIIKKVGKIDILINNAGVSLSNLFIDITEEEWNTIFDINVKGTFNCSQYILKNCMLKRKYGKIINISSMWGQVGASCESAYSASKAAIIGLTKSLAKELGPSNINVNAICPGVIQTKMLDCYTSEDLEELKLETPLNRLGNPNDIANFASFLCTDEATFITGQIFGINGGYII